jgi:8-oxo-dGTP pyrophosphatase MutT (NUDIX family)
LSEQAKPHKLFQVGQKAFIERDGQVLVVFFPNGRLDFPGGRIDEGESDIVEALKREVREETTLEIEVGEPFATWLGRGETVYLVGYRCRYLTGEVQLSDEHGAFKWVGEADYADLDDGSPPFQALRKYFRKQ